MFKGRLHESTSTICKIRNSGQIKIITTKVTGEIKAKDFSDTCNSLSKECLREIRRYLKERTDLTHMQPDITADFQTVDIGLPVPFLKVGMFAIVAVYFKFQNRMHICVQFFFLNSFSLLGQLKLPFFFMYFLFMLAVCMPLQFFKFLY